MDTLGLILVIASLLSSTAAFIWMATRNGGGKSRNGPAFGEDLASDQVEKDVEHIFNDEFRQELRNRGKLHFEKIIGENAMFLQQDLRLSTSQLNEFMKQEITKKLQDEFSKYEESITDAKQLAVESIKKTQQAIEEQRKLMGDQLTKEINEERTRLIKRFEQNMSDVVNHYVLAAIGDQIDLNDQLEYILGDLEANKDAIIRDLTNGA